MSLKTMLLAAGIIMVAAAPAFAATHDIRADRAALAAARADLHKDFVHRAHDRHALYMALRRHDKRLSAEMRHKVAVDNASIRRDIGVVHHARLDLHRDYVAMHHPVLHPTHS